MYTVKKYTKKLLIGISLFFVLLFAFGYSHVSAFTFDNHAHVDISTDSTSQTGGNTIGQGGNNNQDGSGNGVSTNSTLHTGNATTQTTIINNVNTNIVKTGCNCTPTPAPTSVQPTSSPTSTPGNGGGGNNGGGNSNGSSGSSSNSSGSSSPKQSVLSASTMASTGTFENALMNSMLFIGMIILSLGGLSYAKESNR